MKRKCLQCGVVNFEKAELCIRCKAVLVGFDDSSRSSLKAKKTGIKPSVVFSVLITVIIPCVMFYMVNRKPNTVSDSSNIEKTDSVKATQAWVDTYQQTSDPFAKMKKKNDDHMRDFERQLNGKLTDAERESIKSNMDALTRMDPPKNHNGAYRLEVPPGSFGPPGAGVPIHLSPR